MQRLLLAVGLALALAWPAAVHADAFADAVLALNAESFDAKIAAIDGLAALGDERAIPILADLRQ